MHKTKTNKTKTQHMRWTPLCANKYKRRRQDTSPPTNNWRQRQTEHRLHAEIVYILNVKHATCSDIYFESIMFIWYKHNHQLLFYNLLKIKCKHTIIIWIDKTKSGKHTAKLNQTYHLNRTTRTCTDI